MPQGGGRGLAKVSRDIFSKILSHFEPFFVFWPVFFEGKRLVLKKAKYHATRGWGRGPRQCHQMTHGGGGLKWAKKCHVLFEWPLDLKKIGTKEGLVRNVPNMCHKLFEFETIFIIKIICFNFFPNQKPFPSQVLKCSQT
jgi:hypothetical protein